MPRRPQYENTAGYRFGRTYDEGYNDGYEDCLRENRTTKRTRPTQRRSPVKKAVRRKKSKWQIYMGQKKNQIKLRNGKLNLKKMGVAYRKKNKK